MASETDSSVQAHSNGTSSAAGQKTKLHGRAFYESIGSPKLILAPMVEQSEFVCLIESIQSPDKH
jgi:tRNA-dihydrouridine synthase 1